MMKVCKDFVNKLKVHNTNTKASIQTILLKHDFKYISFKNSFLAYLLRLLLSFFSFFLLD